MMRTQVRAFLSDLNGLVFVALLFSLGCDREEHTMNTSHQSVRARAEAAIRTSRAFDGSLLCETKVGGRTLLTFRDDPAARGTRTLDVDPFPMVLVDTARMTAKVLVRRPLVNSASAADEVLAPEGVDSSGAVEIAAQVAPQTSTLHCVIPADRAYFVETIVRNWGPEAGVRGVTVIVPRGGAARAVGTFEEPR